MKKQPKLDILKLLKTPEFKEFSQKHLGHKITTAKAGEWIKFRRWVKRCPNLKQVIVKNKVISYNSKHRDRIIKRTLWAKTEKFKEFKHTWAKKTPPQYWGGASQMPYYIKNGWVWAKIQNNWIFNIKPKSKDFKYANDWLMYKIPKNHIALLYRSNDSHVNYLLLPTSLSLDDFFWEGLGLQQGDGSQDLKSCHITFTNGCLPLIIHQLEWFSRFGISKQAIRVYPEIPKTFDKQKRLQSLKTKLGKVGVLELQFRRLKGGKAANAKNIIVQIVFHNLFYSVFYVFLLHYLRKTILANKKYAKAYLRGIIAAEGCVRTGGKLKIPHTVKISVKSKCRRKFYKDCLQRIGVKPSKDELTKGSEAVIITSYANFSKLYQMSLLALHPLKQEKLTTAFKNYKRVNVIL